MLELDVHQQPAQKCQIHYQLAHVHQAFEGSSNFRDAYRHRRCKQCQPCDNATMAHPPFPGSLKEQGSIGVLVPDFAEFGEENRSGANHPEQRDSGSSALDYLFN
jgi:hypothetical protein